MNEMCEKCEERFGTVYVSMFKKRFSAWLCDVCEQEYNESIIDMTEYQMEDR